MVSEKSERARFSQLRAKHWRSEVSLASLNAIKNLTTPSLRRGWAFEGDETLVAKWSESCWVNENFFLVFYSFTTIRKDDDEASHSFKTLSIMSDLFSSSLGANSLIEFPFFLPFRLLSVSSCAAYPLILIFCPSSIVTTVKHFFSFSNSLSSSSSFFKKRERKCWVNLDDKLLRRLGLNERSNNDDDETTSRWTFLWLKFSSSSSTRMKMWAWTDE